MMKTKKKFIVYASLLVRTPILTSSTRSTFSKNLCEMTEELFLEAIIIVGKVYGTVILILMMKIELEDFFRIKVISS